jgi:hypothetical protein
MDETQGMLFLCFFSYFFAPSEPDNCKQLSCFIDLIDTNTRTELNSSRSRANSIIEKLWHKVDNLPPFQPRANTWDGSYRIRRGRISRKYRARIKAKLLSGYVYARQLRCRFIHPEIHVPHKYSEFEQAIPKTFIYNALFANVLPKARTTSHENVSIWDVWMICDTYGLGIPKVTYKTLRYGWLFGRG